MKMWYVNLFLQFGHARKIYLNRMFTIANELELSIMIMSTFFFIKVVYSNYIFR